MNKITVREWEIEESDLIRLFRMFIPYRKKFGLELGFEKFFESHTKFCLGSGLDAIETILLHEWKGKRKYEGGCLHRYVKREHTNLEWQNKIREYNNRCAYCGIELGKITKDHVLPISKGGRDTIDNIVPSCWPCNHKKRAMEISQWLIQCERK